MAKRTRLKMWGVVLVFLFGLQFVTVAAGDVIYVDDDGSTMLDAAGFSREISEDGTITAIHPGRGATATLADRPEYTPDQLIFKLATPDVKRGGPPIQAQQLLQQVAQRHKFDRTTPVFAKSTRRPLTHIYLARLPAGVSPREAIEQLETDPAIEWAEPHYYRYTQETTPNDPSYLSQWHLPKIEAPSAWDVTTGDPNVVIAIIDTGVDWDHPDLAANIWINTGEIEGDANDNDENGYIDDVRGWDFVTVDAGEVYAGEDPGPPDNDPMDFYGHGTHVAGIAGAVGNNGIGVTGVCWNVRLMVVRAGYKNSSGKGVLQIADVANALIYAADNGADIVNMSFGGYDVSHTERLAIDYCAAADVLLVAGAGNDSTDAPLYPAGFNKVVAVASTEWHDCRSNFSNYGVWIDVAAPGSCIHSTLLGGDYGDKSGTSMASPVIAGLAGLVKAAHPAWTAERIALQLRATATNINAYNPNFVNLLGAGLVAADQAVTIATPPVRLGVVSLCAEETTGSSDGWFDPNETVELRAGISNFSLPQAGVSVSLTTTDPYVSVIDGASFVGDVGEKRIATLWYDPFTILIDASVCKDYIALLNLEISTASSGVVAVDKIPLRLNPLLGTPKWLAQHTTSFDYTLPQILTMSQNEITVLYRSNGFAENLVYARWADSGGDWGPAVQISDPAVTSIGREHNGAVAADGRVYVSFMGRVQESEYEIFHASRDPNSGSWSLPEQVSDGAESNFPSDDIVNTIAVDPLGHPHIVWADYRSGIAEFFYAYYDGLSWSNEAMIAQPSADPGPLHIVFDSAGIGYLLWGQHEDHSIYMMKLVDGSWFLPALVTAVPWYTGLSVTVDSQDYLHMVYTAPNTDDVSYRQYNGTAWSTAEVIMLDTFVHGLTPLISAGPGDVLHVLREAQPDFPTGAKQIYETVHNGMSWSSVAPITFDRTGTEMSQIDFDLDGSGTRMLVGVVDTDPAGTFVPDTDIIFVTSDRDPNNLPTRPVVMDEGITTANRNCLHASWSSSHSSGIAEYEYGIGTVPGEADLRYWTSAGTATSATIDLTNTPLLAGQIYYVSVRARNTIGYWSPYGSSDGITYQPADFDEDGRVALKDFGIFALAWQTEDGQPGWNPLCNLYDGDLVIDMLDLRILAGNWLAGVAY